MFAVSGTEMGKLDQEGRSFTFISPNFPNYPEPDTEVRCIMKQINNETFHFEILEAWVTSEHNLNQNLESQFVFFGRIINRFMPSPHVMVNRFNRFINFTSFIGIEYSMLLLHFLSLQSGLKFSLEIEGNVF